MCMLLPPPPPPPQHKGFGTSQCQIVHKEVKHTCQIPYILEQAIVLSASVNHYYYTNFVKFPTPGVKSGVKSGGGRGGGQLIYRCIIN
jgi:hypothetical protein